MCLLPSTPMVRSRPWTVPSFQWHAWQRTSRQVGAPQSGHVGTGIGALTNRARPPQLRPQVLTCEVRGRERRRRRRRTSRAATAPSLGSRSWYRRCAAVGVTSRPSCSRRSTISGSALVRVAACVVPSPSQAPRVYGSTRKLCCRQLQRLGVGDAVVEPAVGRLAAQRRRDLGGRPHRRRARGDGRHAGRLACLRARAGTPGCRSATGAARRRPARSRPRSGPRSRGARSSPRSQPTTRVGTPSAPITSSPTWTSPIVVQPVGVGIGVSSASALPIAGRAARTIIWPGCRPLVSRSRSEKPVGHADHALAAVARPPRSRPPSAR